MVLFHGQQMPEILTYIEAKEGDVGSDDESVSDSEESDKAMDSQRGDSTDEES